MKKLTLVLVILGMIMLSGCPELGIENPVAQGNTLVVHNNVEVDLVFLSVVKVLDECAEERPRGINLMPDTLSFGESFTLDELDDGRYYCHIARYSNGDGSLTGYVTLSGGNTTDWYVQ